MTLFKLAFIFFMILFASCTKSFINKVAVFKRANCILKRHNYIITAGDIHEGLAFLNRQQITAVNSLVYNSDPNHTLFLVEDIASIKTSHPLLNSVVVAINTTYNSRNMKAKIPIVTLVNYALGNKKNAANIDDRAHTLIQTIFYYLVISHIQKTKYSLRLQQPLVSACMITLPEIGFILTEFLNNFENDYSKICTKLRTLENNANNPQSQDYNREVKDLKHYIEFYKSFVNNIKTDNEYAKNLISKNSDLIVHLVNEYKSYKNIQMLNLESPVDGFNFNVFAGSSFLARMLNFGSYAVELKALKFVLENLNTKSKIFIFAGQKHIENLNNILEKMSFKKIYLKTQTEDISKIYSPITDHIQQAKSFNKVNSNYILRMKQNLKPINAEFFRICQKKHLYAKDFKNLR